MFWRRAEPHPDFQPLKVEEDDQSSGSSLPDSPDDPPYPILLSLQVLFMSYVMVQYHFSWGSNGNDGLPGVFDKRCDGVEKRKMLLLCWYLPLYLGAFLIPIVLFQINVYAGAVACTLWFVALFGVTGRAELWPEYWQRGEKGNVRIYPSGVRKPVDYNITVYTPSTEIHWNSANARFVVLQNVKHLQQLMLVLSLLPLRPGKVNMFVGALHWIVLPSVEGEHLEFLFGDFDLDSYWRSLLPTLYRIQVWATLIGVVIWAFVFAHYATKPDDVLRKSAKQEPGGLKGFKVFIVLLDIFGSVLFLPLVHTLAHPLIMCAIHETGHGDRCGYGACWETEHIAMSVVCMLVLIIYLPVAAGACIINSCCDGAFEDTQLGIKTIPTLNIFDKLSFAVVSLLKVLATHGSCLRKVLFCVTYGFVCVCYCWDCLHLRSRDSTCTAKPGTPNRELRLGDQGVYNAYTVYGLNVQYFIWFVIKLYACVVVLVVSVMGQAPCDNSVLLMPIVVIAVVGFPMYDTLGRALGLRRPAPRVS